MGQAAGRVVQQDQQLPPPGHEPGGDVEHEDQARDTRHIRAQIEDTRVEMSHTIDAIQQRLNPERLTEQAKDAVLDATVGRAEEAVERTVRKAESAVNNATDAARGFGSAVMDTIRENPIPAALAGIGIGWLVMNGRSRTDHDNHDYEYGASSARRNGGAYRGTRAFRTQPYAGSSYAGSPSAGPTYGRPRSFGGPYAAADLHDTEQEGGVSGMASRARDAVAGATEQARDTTANVAGQAREMVGGAVDSAQEAAGDLADTVQYGASRVEDQFQHLLHTNPLAVGAIAVGVGAAVGAGLPRTRREDQMVGPVRDRVMEQAQDTAEELRDRVQHVAQEAQHTAVQEAKAQGLTQTEPTTSGGNSAGPSPMSQQPPGVPS